MFSIFTSYADSDDFCARTNQASRHSGLGSGFLISLASYGRRNCYFPQGRRRTTKRVVVSQSAGCSRNYVRVWREDPSQPWKVLYSDGRRQISCLLWICGRISPLTTFFNVLMAPSMSSNGRSRNGRKGGKNATRTHPPINTYSQALVRLKASFGSALTS